MCDQPVRFATVSERRAAIREARRALGCGRSIEQRIAAINSIRRLEGRGTIAAESSESAQGRPFPRQ